MRIQSLFILAILPLFIISCVTDGKLTKINPEYIFHDNSSKVWLINHCYKDGKDFSPLSNKYKEIITFHKSSNCYVQPMNTFGDEMGRKGNFNVNGEKKTFYIEYPDEFCRFDIKLLSHDKIILVPKGKFPYTLELIPVPEP